MSNISKSTVTSATKTESQKSITWNYLIYVKNGDIHAEKEIRIWKKKGSVWHCLEVVLKSISWEIGYFDEADKLQYTNDFNEKLFVNRDAIQFNGGFLKFDDPGLINPLENIGIELPDAPVSSSSWSNKPNTHYDPLSFSKLQSDCYETIEKTLHDYVEDPLKEFGLDEELSLERPKVRLNPVGRSFHIEIDLHSEPDQTKFQPILYFPMGDNNNKSYRQKTNNEIKEYGQIYAGVWSHQLSHLVYWKISFYPRYLCIPYQIDGMHKLIISQDANWNISELRSDPNKPTQFEFFANSIGLHLIDSDPDPDLVFANNEPAYSASNTYVFAPGERNFFVGIGQKTPALKSEDPTDENMPLNPNCPSKVALFKGKIKRIFFDPNSPCDGC